MTEHVEKKDKKEKVAKVAKEKVEKIQQNDVTRPKAGTATATVWEIAERLSNEAGAVAKRADVMKACEEAGINAATTATQYGKWRKFHGIVAEPKAAKVAAEEPATEGSGGEAGNAEEGSGE